MHRPIIACVGGFLGAGNTTALVAAARTLAARGMRVGLVANEIVVHEVHVDVGGGEDEAPETADDGEESQRESCPGHRRRTLVPAPFCSP